ncbi:beta-ketoacyl-[acyl-carrier-protein] synthase family protein [Roseomonas hellenica]|uniref:Beta-ketoacyl-[acyl-carrier-protein] synthase family protein n=1 Tax=Plastoroseomonas hellenica TaxID=2687306 RepID=A0ABS5EZQ1_9PROT|nr:beta-ketoacyl-[acyl-carrier-protein] synthase family protein [Plastoroseomonas hellenica]MBR0665400.1 beta-ketoacyl-[acyl-carrier-protein] synthase family protein [Plastoroseomonas hellenica]
MTPLRLSAFTTVSALGAGTRAARDALLARRGGLAPCTLPDMPAGIWTGEAAGLDQVRLPAPLASYACRNNVLAELTLRQDGFAEAVAEAARRHGATRVAVMLGTSTSGIEETEQAWRRRDAAGALPGDLDYQRTHDLHSLSRYVRARLGLRGPAFSLSTACTSGARSFLDGAALIESGIADAVVVGGADTLCRLTLHGFASLELLSSAQCRPCSAERDGISIGEAAAFMLLERATPDDAGRIGLLGGGASSDGHHMSSPHPDGIGAIGAMRAALESAGIEADAIDYINMHGTGTRANDAMEDRAIARIFGDAVPASSTKGWSGHTLGASGALEAVIAAICVDAGLIPGCLGVEVPDPSFESQIATHNLSQRVDRVLSNSFGFGGSNCCLVIGRIP